jgi:hypothetical protein
MSWVAFDLDGTLARHDQLDYDPSHIGEPIQPMVDLLKQYLAGGMEVRIFTARVATDGSTRRDIEANQARIAIMQWCQKYLDTVLPITCQKDWDCVVIYDDRARQVDHNKGTITEDRLKREIEKLRKRNDAAVGELLG